MHWLFVTLCTPSKEQDERSNKEISSIQVEQIDGGPALKKLVLKLRTDSLRVFASKWVFGNDVTHTHARICGGKLNIILSSFIIYDGGFYRDELWQLFTNFYDASESCLVVVYASCSLNKFIGSCSTFTLRVSIVYRGILTTFVFLL